MTKFLNYAYSYRSWVNKTWESNEVDYCDYRLSAIGFSTDTDFSHGETSSICKGMLLTCKYLTVVLVGAIGVQVRTFGCIGVQCRTLPAPLSHPRLLKLPVQSRTSFYS
jgi:hypothetical protein